MSWMKRGQGGAPPPAAEQQPYAASQPYGNQQNMFTNYQGAPVSTQQQQQYWQMQQHQQQQPPQSQFNQQYGQMYQQQGYGNNANQFYQPPNQYNQNFANQNFNNTQQGYPQNYYVNQGAPQQNFVQNNVNTDSWEDNWDWGWEDSSKQKPTATQRPTQESATQPIESNNANAIQESFVPTNTWNWAMEEKKEPQEKTSSSTLVQENKEPSVHSQVNPKPDVAPQVESSQGYVSNPQNQNPSEEVKTLNDRDVVKERLPNLALGKRFHIENLTPQWSIESQMSQESSDGPQTHSEGTYRSENPSRNSSKGSPGPGNSDNSNFNISQSHLDEMYSQSSEWSKHSNEDGTLMESHKGSSSRRESHEELSSSMQEMSISNAENIVSNITKTDNELEQKVSEFLPPPLQPPLATSPADFVQSVSSNVPTKHISSAMPPPPPVSTATQQPSTAATASGPPPTIFPPPTTSQNPFKHAGPFSHKNISKAHTNVPSQAFLPQPNSNLSSPTVIGKISQNSRMPVGYGANLETTPDNSERPDQPQAASFRPMPLSQQIPDNLEVAPQNDRNEYLQTEHLSSVDYGENTDFSRNIPPPGLRRMVVGQQEAEYNQNLNVSGDEPPPGLARMVPGQQTESDSIYIQSNDNYMERHVDGQMNDNAVRTFRQADGQQTSDNYTQPPPNRSSDRRPIGLDRMVPGESSNNDYTQYSSQGGNYGSSNEGRVVTGVDHDYPLRSDTGPTDVREQNVDGSDYTEPTVRNPARNVIGLREPTNDSSVDFGAAPEEQQREVTMEGENLQDLSIISGAEMTYSREQIFDVVSGNITEVGKDRSHEASDSVEYPANGSRRQSVNRVNTSGEDSERDRTFKSSPRLDKDKHKSSRDRDRDREKDKDGRYSRGDRDFNRDPDRRSVRDGRRSEKDRRDRDRDRDKERERRNRDREMSPESRRHRRSTRSHRYETEDTDYYSDRERDRRRYREGSYSSKPPRPDEKQRQARHDDRRRYKTTDRDDYDEEGGTRRRSDRHRDRYERRYRDIDPTRKYGNLRREEEERRRGETYSSPSRAGSREATATDEDAPDSERRRRERDRRPRDRQPDPYYMAAGYGRTYGDPFLLQRQQYSYYERLRRTDPAAYTRLYEQLLAAPHNLYAEGYGPMGYEARGEERASVHSGRSSANGLKPTDTYYGGCRLDGGSLRDAPSLRTDLSDRDLNTDASLNLHLEESTVRSERMTPFKFSTAHIKGSVSAQHLVVVRAAYPVDGRPATVQLLPLATARKHDPQLPHLLAYPGPLLRGVTHKKSVIEYCKSRVNQAQFSRDPLGYVLLWELLALMLRQNGVVVGTDIAELLMKNAREYEYKPANKATPRPESRSDSSPSGEGPREEQRAESAESGPPAAAAEDEGAALDRFRDHLLYGNRQEALEWAMARGLWGHALQLAAHGERRTRAAVAARFVASLPPQDPLHSLYKALAAHAPPAATCVAEERWGDWRPHAAILLANGGARPDHDRRTLTQLGDSLASRGLPFCAQFCYVAGGEPFSRHPLAPLQPSAAAAANSTPRLALLLADPRAATLRQLATDEAIFATEVYEYALSLSQEDFVIEEFQVYKLVAACRLLDAGQCERALAYVERAARAVTQAPRRHSPALAARLARLADRLKYYDPALQEEPPLVDEAADGSGQPSPRHHRQWLDDVKQVADMLQAEAWQQQQTPQHGVHPEPIYHDQTLQYQQPIQTYANDAEDRPDYSGQYYQATQQSQQPQMPQMPQPPQLQHYQQEGSYPQHEQSGGAHGEAESHPQTHSYAEDWPRAEDQSQSYADSYWQNDSHYGYGEVAPGDGEGAEPRPSITMPGAAPSKPAPFADYETDEPPKADADREPEASEGARAKADAGGRGGAEGRAKGGWLGGILTKLSLRAPNQMILPDDKNPTIVWDAEHKRWRNLDSDGEEAPRPPPPPPAHPHAPALAQQSGAAGAPGAPPVSNIFKMQKGRNLKKSYVDVLNPAGASARAPPPAGSLPPAPPPAPPQGYFVPAPLAQQGDYYDGTMATGDGEPYRSGI